MGLWHWGSPNWCHDSILIGSWQVAGISWLGGQAIKPWSDVGKIIHFKLNSSAETFGTFLQRIVEEKNCAKHGTSLFLNSNFPSPLFHNKVKLVVPKHTINCTILNCNVLGTFSWEMDQCHTYIRDLRGQIDGNPHTKEQNPITVSEALGTLWASRKTLYGSVSFNFLCWVLWRRKVHKGRWFSLLLMFSWSSALNTVSLLPFKM